MQIVTHESQFYIPSNFSRIMHCLSLDYMIKHIFSNEKKSF